MPVEPITLEINGVNNVGNTIDTVSKKVAAMANKAKFLTTYSKKADMSVNNFSMGVRKLGYTFDDTGKFVDAAGKRVKGLDAVIKNVRASTKKFNMEWLSVMFAGMIIQRVFTNIARSTVAAFNKIMESSGFLGTSLNRLTAYWTFLKFEVGRAIDTALRPLLPLIITIINAFVKFTNAHPGFVAGFIVIGVIVGGLLFLLGNLATSINGIGIIFAKVGAKLAASGGFAALIGSFAMIVFWVALIVIGLMILKKAYEKNWFGFADAVNSAVPAMKLSLEGLYDVLVSILTLDLNRFAAGIMKAISGLAISLWNYIINLFNGVSQGILKVLSKIPLIGGAFKKLGDANQFVAENLTISPETVEGIGDAWDDIFGVTGKAAESMKAVSEPAEKAAESADILSESGFNLSEIIGGTGGLNEQLDAALKSFEGSGEKSGLIPALDTTASTINDSVNPKLEDMGTKMKTDTEIADELNASMSRLYSTFMSYNDAKTSTTKSKSSGSRQFGGDIPETGMYMMHKGEQVTTSSKAGSGGNTVNITINGNVNEDIYKRLVAELRRYGPVTKLGR